MLITVKDACTLQENVLDVRAIDQIEQLDELITTEDNGAAFFARTHITAGMCMLIAQGLARPEKKMITRNQSCNRGDLACCIFDWRPSSTILYFNNRTTLHRRSTCRAGAREGRSAAESLARTGSREGRREGWECECPVALSA